MARPSAEHVFHVTTALVNHTLAAAMRHWLPGQSWSHVRQLIESRRVMVSGNPCVDAGRRLQPGDVVKLLAQPAAAAPKEHDVRVQYLDEHLIVVEKPAGMTSNRHREERRWPKRRKQLQPTLDELLPHIITAIEGRRGRHGVPRPVRAVHRLDRDTSGLIVFARTPAAERHLAEQFRLHTASRRYLAIVAGQVEAQTISSRLVRDRGDGRRGSTDNPNLGKAAITHIKPIDHLHYPAERGAGSGTRRGEGEGAGNEGPGYTLIECRLETGRTHQIRIHLSERGHPVCGDKLYRQPLRGKPSPDASGAPRLALHAAELGFVHPVTAKPLRFEAPIPPDLSAFWQQLKSAH